MEKEKYCMCKNLTGVARDGKSTCLKCGGIDAYGSKSRRKMKEELKTLKDIEKIEKDYEFAYIHELKQEAIKWIKEDMKLINNNVLLRIEKAIAERFIERWTFRFNITEDDLK